MFTTGLPANAQVQRLARQVLAELPAVIGPDSSEASIAAHATFRLRELGLTETWYYDCPALVLAGSRTCLSVSGRDYVADARPIGTDNLVTVDLSPASGPLWGDCARSFVVERGRVVAEPADPMLADGLRAERQLHAQMRRFVEPSTTFDALHAFAERLAASLGYENLDFRGNFGHSIAARRADRVYIERGNDAPVGSVACFTFEPHIRRAYGQWGFKHEEIYFFDAGGRAVRL